jgi:hypothetical protein
MITRLATSHNWGKKEESEKKTQIRSLQVQVEHFPGQSDLVRSLRVEAPRTVRISNFAVLYIYIYLCFETNFARNTREFKTYSKWNYNFWTLV